MKVACTVVWGGKGSYGNAYPTRRVSVPTHAAPNHGLQATPSSVRSCLAVRRDSSNRLPANRVGNRRNVPKVSRLTGADTGRRDQRMAATQEA